MVRRRGSMLKAFRRQTGVAGPRTPPLSRREQWILGCLIVHLQILFWCLGGIPVWTHPLFLLSAGLAFLWLFLPIQPETGLRPLSTPSRVNLRLLVRSPLFWSGVALFLYMAIQNLNPAYRYQSDGSHWWMKRLDPIDWLPTGIEAPYRIDNGWRTMAGWGAAWLAGCAFWIGIQRRRALRMLGWTLVVGLFLWAAVAVVQEMVGATKIIGLFRSPHGFYGTLVNDNHAAALLNCGLVVCLTLFFYYEEECHKRLARSGPHFLMAALAVVFLLAVARSLSRAGLAITLAIVVLAAVLFVAELWRHGRRLAWPALLAGGLLVLVFVRFAYPAVKPHLLKLEFEKTEQAVRDPLIEERYFVYQAAWEMFEARWPNGWGAGGFRYAFVPFAKQYPIAFQGYRLRLNPETQRQEYEPIKLYYSHAHSDFLQLLAELGVAGVAPLLVLAGWMMGKFIRLRKNCPTSALLTFVGGGLVLSHSLVDFPLYMPVISSSLLVILLWALKWADLEDRARRREAGSEER